MNPFSLFKKNDSVGETEEAATAMPLTAPSMTSVGPAEPGVTPPAAPAAAAPSLTPPQNPSEAKPKEETGRVFTVSYGTGMPIDVIYGYINRDCELEGYQDALVNGDAEYCQAKESIMVNKLRQLFKQVHLRYRGDIMQLNVKIANCKALFALTSAAELEAYKQICEEHMTEISEMMKKLESQSPEMLTMIETYRRGFTKGCASQAAMFINPRIK